MAEATKFENMRALVDGSTITGPARFYILLSAGADTAVLTLTIGSNTIVLKAVANTSIELTSCIRLGGGVSASVGLTGTAPTAYAIDDIR
jgi:hypothetical protein